jgi:hypothetical protein
VAAELAGVIKVIGRIEAEIGSGVKTRQKLFNAQHHPVENGLPPEMET